MNSSLFEYFDKRNIKPKVGQILVYPCGVSIKIIQVDGDYIKAEAVTKCEDVKDLSKATLFSKGRFIPSSEPFKPEGDCPMKQPEKRWEARHD